jgi:Phage tail tube protein
MALPTGLASQWGMAQETTNGTPATVTRFYEFNSESLKLKKNTVQGKGLRAGGLFMRTSRRVVGSWEAAGDVNLDTNFNGMGLLFQNMIGSFSATAVQQASTTAYLQTHAPGSLGGKTFTVQVGKPGSDGTVYPFTYPGCKITDWTLSTEVNKYANLVVNIDGWQELTLDNPTGTSAGPALASASYTPSTGAQFFHFRQATLYNGGTLATASGITTLSSPVAAARVTKCSIKVANPVDTSRFFIAGTGGTGGSSIAGVKSEQLENEFRVISGSLDAEFFSPSTYYDVFAGDTTATLELLFTGPAIGVSGHNYSLGVLIPNIKYDGDSPAVAGPGILTEALPFSGLDDETDNQIQIQYMSTDTTV